MSAPGWMKVAGGAAAAVILMVLGSVILPDFGSDSSPDGTPLASPTPHTINGAGGHDEDHGQVVVVESAHLAEVVEAVTPSVVLVESLDGPPGPNNGNQVTSGSGFVVDQAGHIVTNYHVIEGLDEVKVTFPDRAAYRAEVVGNDPGSDLAVLRVDRPEDELDPVRFADSDSVRPGDPVFAIGAPFSHRLTVTSGVVSAVGRTTQSTFTQRSIRDVIQIDAAVNPGNSGGPLFNYEGEVVGVNTSIENPNGRFFVGIGFAVPSNTTVRHLPTMVAGGTVEHAQLGVTVEPIDAVVAEELGLAVSRGVYVVMVTPGSAADRAGIEAAPSTGGELVAGGDVIVELGGMPIASFEELSSAIDRHDVGDEVAITVYRDGDEVALTAELQVWDVQ